MIELKLLLFLDLFWQVLFDIFFKLNTCLILEGWKGNIFILFSFTRQMTVTTFVIFSKLIVLVDIFAALVVSCFPFLFELGMGMSVRMMGMVMLVLVAVVVMVAMTMAMIMSVSVSCAGVMHQTVRVGGSSVQDFEEHNVDHHSEACSHGHDFWLTHELFIHDSQGGLDEYDENQGPDDHQVDQCAQ